MLLKDRLGYLIWLFSYFTLAISIGVYSGYWVGVTGVVVSSLIGLYFFKPKWEKLDRDDYLLFFAFLLFSLSLFFASCLDDFQIKELDRAAMFIFALPFLLVFLNVSNHKEWLWYGVITGAFLAFIMALYERLVLGIYRVHGAENAILFGNVGLMLGFLSLAGAMYFYTQKRYVELILSLSGGLLGIGVSILSGTRGGWVCLPLIGLFFFWQCCDLLGRKRRFLVFSFAFLCIGLAVSLPETGIQKRIYAAVSNINSYVTDTNKDTSVGLRFEMWRSAIYMFEQSPILGVGKSQVMPIKSELASTGMISRHAVPFDHVHNEYLEALSVRGIIGLLFLLSIYLIPLSLFLKKIKQHRDNWNIRSYAIAGSLIPMCYMDFGLTQAMFSFNVGVIMYAFPVVYFWGAVRLSEKEAT